MSEGNKANLLGTLISGGVDLLGNFLGFKSNKDTNKSNHDIAQMNNEFNERMLQKQMDYNYDMWNKQNAYNTPDQQRKRFEAAGFNPYMMLGNIQAGQAATVGGVNPPTAQPVSMQPFHPDFSGLGHAVQSYVANRIVEQRNEASIAVDKAKANQINIENKYKAADLASTIWKKIEDTHNVRQKRMYQEMLNNTFEQQFSSDMREKEANIRVLEATAREKDVDIAIKQIHKSNIPKQYQLTFASLAADVLLKKAQENLTWEQAWREMQTSFKEQAQAYRIGLDNKIIEQTCKDIISQAESQAKMADKQNDWYHVDKFIDNGSKVLQLVPKKNYSTGWNSNYGSYQSYEYYR